MDEAERELFRLKLRLSLMERLISRVALLPASSFANAEAADQSSRLALEDWVEKDSERLGEFYGSALDDAASEVILSEEARELARKMKATIASVARDLDRS
jgi:hypothetical protein